MPFSWSSSKLCLWLALSPILASTTPAAPGSPPAGYELTRVTDSVPATALEGMSQLAFRPGDASHVFAARTYTGAITRYDYAAGGTLSNPLDVAIGLPYPVGLGFRGSEIFVSLNRTNDGRIARLRDLNQDGIYEERMDFVRGIPRGDHHVNQLQIRGNTLWTSVGQRGNSGNPIYENVYTGTLVRVADLDDVDFAGGTNHLPDSTTFVNPVPIDGLLRRYGYGFRNAFGVRLDSEGRLWVTDNGASACSACSAPNRFPIDTPDLVYRDVQPGDKGIFPPDGYPGGGGATIEPLTLLGIHAAATGLDFIPQGRDAGMLLVAEYGPSDTTIVVGRDIVMVDPADGSVGPFIVGFNRPTDVLADPLGNILIADYGARAIYRLSVPALDAPDAPPDTRNPVRLVLSGPEPFTVNTRIDFFLPEPAAIILRAFSLGGREVTSIAAGQAPRGWRSVFWDGRDGVGDRLPPGAYWIRLETPSGVETRRLTRIR